MVVTVTSTVLEPAGEVALHELVLQFTPVAAIDPKETLPPVRFVPVIVTGVPPVAGPLFGEIPVTAGAGSGLPPGV